MAQCMAMGQAAGTAAAMASARRRGARSVAPRDLDIGALRDRLRARRRHPRAGRPRRRTAATMTFVRTVLGDIAPGDLGVTYAHEHLIIDGGRPVQMAARVRPGRRGGDGAPRWRTRPPSGCGRSWTRCPAMPGATPGSSRISRAAPGVHVIAPTGLHHDRYYGPAHWSARITVEEMAELFVVGRDRRDRRLRLRRAGRAPDPVPCRRDQGGRQRGRALGLAIGACSRRRPRPTSGPGCRS